MKESIYLLRANPSLTTNVKLVCDSSYNLYLESYSANKELSDNKYKKVLISSDSFISERLANFYKDLPSNLAFEVKNTIKSDTIQKDINLQYDDTYYSGMRMVEDTRYVEEFQYNTTLKIVPNNLPKWFFIFRQDGTGLEDINGLDSKKLKVVKFFDLSKSTNIGKLFQKNYIDDDVIPESPFELNLKKFEFSKWNGYDYKSGGSVSKSMFLEDYMRNETTHYEMEKFVTSQFQKNDVICSNYLNISFLFDDTVSGIFEKSTSYNIETDYKFMNEDIYNGDFKIGQDLIISNNTFSVTEEKSYRKRWSINRYYGFYVNELIPLKKISPTIPALLNTSNISIYKNEFIVTGSSTLLTGAIPVMPLLTTWDINKVYHIKIKETYYLLDKHVEEIKDITGAVISTVDRYYIISDTLFNSTEEGTLSDLISDYDPVIKIIWDEVEKAPYIVYQDNIPLKFDYSFKIKSNSAIFLLIKIYDKYYNIEYIDGDNLTRKCKIITDWYLSCDGNKFIRKYDSNKIEQIFTQILNKEESVPYFEFYVPQLVQIADWDFARDNTMYANIEYDKFAYVNNTRPYLKELNILDVASPKDPVIETNYQIYTPNPLQLFTIFDGIITEYTYPEFYGDNFVLPMASEYATTGDLYMLNKQNIISDIWNVNQSNCKWGYLDSISNVSYPYKLNNHLTSSGINNFTPSPFTNKTDSSEFSLDWFYTIGIPYDNKTDLVPLGPVSINISTLDIYFRTLNIDNPRQYQGYYYDIGFTNYLDYLRFDIDYYEKSTSTLNLFNYFLNLPVSIGEIGDDTIHEIMYKYYVKRTSEFSKGDGYNGPCVFFKGLKAYAEYVKLNDPNNPINPDKKHLIRYTPADDLAGYEFSVLFDNRETVDVLLHGKAGIDVVVNKIHKNVLIYIYVWTPFNCYTSLSYRSRDKAYDEEYVYYTNVETRESVGTELKIQKLKLSVMYEILNNSYLTYDGFSAGIKYLMVEDVTKYVLTADGGNNILDSSDCIYDAAIDGFYITLTLNDYYPIKQGDWVHLQFPTNILAFDGYSKNYKVKSILNNRVTIEFRDTTAAFGFIPFSLPQFVLPYITKEKSVIPFKLRCVLPDQIKINTSVNLITSDSSAPITPDNKLSTINKILINDLNKTKDGTVENVWSNNPLLRSSIKINSENELTYKQIDSLPYINRYSGNYEPIINNVNLFNKIKLVEYGINTEIIPGNIFTPSYIINGAYTFYTKQLVSGGPYKLIIEVVAHEFNGLLNEKNIFEKNDIVFLNFCSFLNSGMGHEYDFGSYVTFPEIANKYVQIEKVLGTYQLNSTEISNLFAMTYPVVIPTDHLVYIIETNMEFDGYNAIYDPLINIYGNASYKHIAGNLFKPVEDNISFDTTLKDFGINKNVIIGKYTNTSDSPLKSSNSIYDDKNKYAMSDEHGVTSIDRNIFKSSWDLKYYYKTIKNKFNT